MDSLDLTHILAAYEKDEARGRRGYDPAMMTKLLVYAYSTGKLTSRAIERVLRGGLLPRDRRRRLS